MLLNDMSRGAAHLVEKQYDWMANSDEKGRWTCESLNRSVTAAQAHASGAKPLIQGLE